MQEPAPGLDPVMSAPTRDTITDTSPSPTNHNLVMINNMCSMLTGNDYNYFTALAFYTVNTVDVIFVDISV